MKPSVGLWVWSDDQEKPPAPPLEAWKAAGVSRVYLKCGDRTDTWPQFAQDLPGLHAMGFEVYAWSFVYGGGVPEAKPLLDAAGAGADALVINAEGQWETNAARIPTALVNAIRAVEPGLPIYLSSFGQPQSHLKMNWLEWDAILDGFMPQVYPDAWNRTPAQAISLTYDQYRALGCRKPIYPTAYCYPQENPVIDAAQLADFLANCEAGGYEHVSFWRDGIAGWDVVDAVAAFSGGEPPLIEQVRTLQAKVAALEAWRDWRPE